MSRQWRRAPSGTLCGGCPNEIERGDPVLYVSLPMVKRELVRCQQCAGEAPPDLPALLVAGGIEASGFTAIGRAAPRRTRGALKELAIKEWMPYRENREPGEDG